MKIKITTILMVSVFLLNCNSANKLATAGIQSLQEGKKLEALKLFEMALEKNDSNPLALYGSGKILIESTITLDIGQQRLAESIENLSVKEYRLDAAATLANSYARVNSYDKAIEVLEDSVSKKIYSEKLFEELAFYHLQVMNPKKAIETLEKGSFLYPDKTIFYIRIAQIMANNQRNPYQALTKITEGIEAIPDNTLLYKSRSIIYYSLKKYDLAINDIEKIKSLDPNGEKSTIYGEWIAAIKARKWTQKL